MRLPPAVRRVARVEQIPAVQPGGKAARETHRFSLAIGDRASEASAVAMIPMIFGICGPRSMQGLRALLQTAWTHFERLLSALDRVVAALVAPMAPLSRAIGG